MLISIATVAVAVVLIGSASLLAYARGHRSEDHRQAVKPTATAPSLDPRDRCVEISLDFLQQVPQAYGQGYTEGLDVLPIYETYGYESRVAAAVDDGQALVLGILQSTSDLQEQWPKVRDEVQSVCFDDEAFADAPEQGLKGLG